MLELKPSKIVWFDPVIEKTQYTFKCKICKNIESEKGTIQPQICVSCVNSKNDNSDYEKKLADVVKS